MSHVTCRRKRRERERERKKERRKEKERKRKGIKKNARAWGGPDWIGLDYWARGEYTK